MLTNRQRRELAARLRAMAQREELPEQARREAERNARNLEAIVKLRGLQDEEPEGTA